MAAFVYSEKASFPVLQTLISYSVPEGRTFYLKGCYVIGYSMFSTTTVYFEGMVYLAVNGQILSGFESVMFTNGAATVGMFAADGNSGRGNETFPYLFGQGDCLGFFCDDLVFSQNEKIELVVWAYPQRSAETQDPMAADSGKVIYKGLLIGELDNGERVLVRGSFWNRSFSPVWRWSVPPGKVLYLKCLVLKLDKAFYTTELLNGYFCLGINGTPYRAFEYTALDGDQTGWPSGMLQSPLYTIKSVSSGPNLYVFDPPLALGPETELSVLYHLANWSISTYKQATSPLYSPSKIAIGLIGELEDIGGEGGGFGGISRTRVQAGM